MAALANEKGEKNLLMCEPQTESSCRESVPNRHSIEHIMFIYRQQAAVSLLFMSRRIWMSAMGRFRHLPQSQSPPPPRWFQNGKDSTPAKQQQCEEASL